MRRSTLLSRFRQSPRRFVVILLAVIIFVVLPAIYFESLQKKWYRFRMRRALTPDELNPTSSFPDVRNCTGEESRMHCVVVPFPYKQLSDVTCAIRRWSNPATRPCTGAPEDFRLIFLYAANYDDAPDVRANLTKEVSDHPDTFNCFKSVHYMDLKLHPLVDHYDCAPYECGPPRVWYSTLFSQELTCMCDYALLLEPDNYPVRNCWLRKLAWEMPHPKGHGNFWIRGPLSKTMEKEEVSQSLERDGKIDLLNGNWIFKLGDQRFLNFTAEMRRENKGDSYDRGMSYKLHRMSAWEKQRVLHEFQFTDYMNTEPIYNLTGPESHPETHFLHVEYPKRIMSLWNKTTGALQCRPNGNMVEWASSVYSAVDAELCSADAPPRPPPAPSSAASPAPPAAAQSATKQRMGKPKHRLRPATTGAAAVRPPAAAPVAAAAAKDAVDDEDDE
eukprot:TRINITY_DN31387_c0_g1_i1.p1 TRINITY_DN31387_c0_g1~~TRINITY_DN31387_c0_g1_i1.p1  ORF type:complete len:445 (-),score=111.46 TRINITY_DN31387_c0_g1_i1:7-1341(-)